MKLGVGHKTCIQTFVAKCHSKVSIWKVDKANGKITLRSDIKRKWVSDERSMK